LASTLEAIPTRGAAGYLEIGLTAEHTENTEVSWKVYGPDMSATTGRLASAVHAGTGGATVNGNLLSVNEGGNGTITRTYDGLNRVTSYTEAGKTIGYRYYASGKLAKVIYPGGTENGVGHIEYTYNADGRLYQVIDRLSSTTTPRTTTYSWNTDGRLATVSRPYGTMRTISYDAAGRPSGISDAGIVWAIGYYASDDIATLDVTPAVPPQSLAAVPATQMTFDAANRLATFNGKSVTHDLDGNMVSGPLPSTGAMGNYTYDSRNRLTGAGGFAYRYNAEGNRVGLTSANETTTLTVDPQGAMPKVLERVKNGVRTRYVYGAGLQYEVNDAGAATYYHYDQSGNTAALTNQAGAIIERVVYSPYGTIRYRQSNFDTPFLYGGFFGVMTDANGLINMRARYYNPLTMRFLNSDPAMDGLNWYAYAGGNPISNSDPSGLNVIYLNNSGAVAGQGHTAALVGSDVTGWNYFSKNGWGNGKWSRDDNVNRPYDSFTAFYNSSESSQYDRAVYVQTTVTQDLNMTIYGDTTYKQNYCGVNNNCGDLVAGIMTAGGVPIPGGSILGTPRPNSQYDSLVKNGIGSAFIMHPNPAPASITTNSKPTPVATGGRK
jgi:RHS repeat-associated protein